MRIILLRVVVTMITPLLYATLITSRVNTLLLRTIRNSRSRAIPWRDSPFRIASPSLRTPLRVPIAWRFLFQFGTHVTFARLGCSPLSFLTRVILERDASRFPADLFTLDAAAIPRDFLRTRAAVFELALAFRSLRLIILLTIGGLPRSRSVAWP